MGTVLLVVTTWEILLAILLPGMRREGRRWLRIVLQLALSTTLIATGGHTADRLPRLSDTIKNFIITWGWLIAISPIAIGLLLGVVLNLILPTIRSARRRHHESDDLDRTM
jgi:hypothetical protein